MKTFWSNKHPLSGVASKLNDLVPFEGPVTNPGKNRALEKFRRASNAYYDIFNNGGGNRGRAISHYFGQDVLGELRPNRWGSRRPNWDWIHRDTEPVMERIVIAAALEQDLTLPKKYRAAIKLERENREAVAC